MKLEPVTKLGKKNAITSRKTDKGILLWQIMTSVSFFQICGQFGVIWKLDSQWMLYKPYIFINSKFLPYKKTLKHSSHTTALIKSTIFVKNANFSKRNDDISIDVCT